MPRCYSSVLGLALARSPCLLSPPAMPLFTGESGQPPLANAGLIPAFPPPEGLARLPPLRPPKLEGLCALLPFAEAGTGGGGEGTSPPDRIPPPELLRPQSRAFPKEGRGRRRAFVPPCQGRIALMVKGGKHRREGKGKEKTRLPEAWLVVCVRAHTLQSQHRTGLDFPG